ncbi:Hint domain-containing protein [Phaeovulum vinaykumarii]
MRCCPPTARRSSCWGSARWRGRPRRNCSPRAFPALSRARAPTRHGARAPSGRCAPAIWSISATPPQPVVWAGRRRLTRDEIQADARLCPVEIRAGAFGNARPLRLSAQHCLWVPEGAGGALEPASRRALLATAPRLLPALLGGLPPEQVYSPRVRPVLRRKQVSAAAFTRWRDRPPAANAARTTSPCNHPARVRSGRDSAAASARPLNGPRTAQARRMSQDGAPGAGQPPWASARP